LQDVEGGQAVGYRLCIKALAGLNIMVPIEGDWIALENCQKNVQGANDDHDGRDDSDDAVEFKEREHTMIESQDRQQ